MYLKMPIKLFFIQNKELRKVARTVSIQEKKPYIFVVLDMLASSVRYGSNYRNYQALDFINRSKENRKSYLTLLYWLDLLKQYNPESQRSVFRDKREFNAKFKKFTGREWLDLEDASEKDIISFAEKYDKLILKSSNGACGKQVVVISSKELLDNFGDYKRVFAEKKINLLEKCIENIEDVKKFNELSLNTMRILTVHSDKSFNILLAAQRIGAHGNYVDNISCGGSSARIDVETGRVIPPFYTNAFQKIDTTQLGWKNEWNNCKEGFVIPYWTETVEMLKKAAQVIPEIHIVGWDVAITPNGPVLIEGNESCDTDVLQYYFSSKEEGLKFKIQEMLKRI